MAFSVKVKNHIDIPKHIKEVKDPDFWKFGAHEWWRLLDPYTPMETGTMSKQVNIRGEEGNGTVHYLAPQAHYLYKGELMVDPKTGSSYAREGTKKVYAGRELCIKKSKHPLATKEWDKAATPTQKPKLIRAMQGYIDSGRLRLGE